MSTPPTPGTGPTGAGTTSAGATDAGTTGAGTTGAGTMATAPADPGPSAGGAGARPAGPRPRGRGTFALRLRGMRLVTSLELRQRLRSKRWYVALTMWTLVMLGIGGLGLAPTLYSAQWDSVGPIAAMVFSLQMILVLFAMLLVVPALSAGSINGDRTAGTLATLQASLLSPAEIVLGKLLAGFLTGLAFLVLALPSVVPIALLGGVGLLYMLRLLLVIIVLTLCVTAVGLGLSALTSRQLGSVVLAYVIVFGVTVVLPIAWGSSAVVLNEEREVTSYYTVWDDESGSVPDRCEAETVRETVPRLDLSLPLLWGNPVVLLAEAAPPLPQDYWTTGDDADLLSMLKSGMRSAATATHPSHAVYCDPSTPGYPTDLGTPPNRPVWPMGLGLWVLAGALSLVVAIRRLAVPIRRLGAGTRIA